MNANESNLFPILPSTIRDSRYPGIVRMRFSPTIKSDVVLPGAGLASVPSYQSQGWTISARPEGKHYAHTTIWAGTTVVTEACVMEPGVSDQLNAWLAVIHSVITEKQINPPETSHLFLEVHQDLGTCNYYFVDHVLHTVFWLHTLDVVSSGPLRSFSNGHLQHSLQENYWIHVELFPETASKYSAAALNEIYDVLTMRSRAGETKSPLCRHLGVMDNLLDALSLEPPPFPYTNEECEELIDILERRKGHASSPHTTAYIARLCATVANHRSLIHFEASGSKRGLISTIVLKVLLFGLPDEHQARFESLCVDRLICTSRWRQHVSETVEDLKQEISRVSAINIAVVSLLTTSP
ncbi:hypothetical protein BJY52DRAFT_413027 [Lactarius psammicola]|nr:hypothetical protein BJY52DRAFT_413027 [Lactarius psammicola]